MAAAAESPGNPGAWCRTVLRHLSIQAGIIRDAGVLETLLTTLAEDDPDADTFVRVLERFTRGPRPEIGAAAGRILRAWERDRAIASGTATEEKPRVLVVDDDPSVCRLLATALERRFAVTTATSGEAALAQARAQPPALVVLDVMMPGMDGYTVARALRTDPTTAAGRIVFCTARGGIDARQLGRDLGADGYVVKPFEVPRLVAQVATLLGLDPLGA